MKIEIAFPEDVITEIIELLPEFATIEEMGCKGNNRTMIVSIRSSKFSNFFVQVSLIRPGTITFGMPKNKDFWVTLKGDKNGAA